MRKLLLLSVAIPALGLAVPALAQVEINTETTDPIDTQSIDNGNPGDIVVLSAGSVLIGAGQTAITLNSDNTVTNQGDIGSNDADNTTGILVSGTVTGGVINSNNISLVEDFTGEDTDEDGDLDGPFAIGTGRVGILVEGSSVFTGNILNDSTGRITVEGNNSAGILIAGTMIGDLTSTGTIDMVGNNSHGIAVTGTIDGNIVTSGQISTRGEGSHGVLISGDVDGVVRNTANILATGFRSTTRADATGREALDADDLLIGGSALAVGASVSGGIINDSFVDENDVLLRGLLRSDGSAPALLVTASLDGVDNGDVNIGAYGSVEDDEFFGIINRGIIAASGVNDGIDATAVRIEGAQINGVLRNTIIEGGFMSSGSITVQAFEANATAVSIGNGAVVPIMDFREFTSANVLSQSGGRAGSIVIDAGSQVNEIRINTEIQATYLGTGSGGFAAGIVDESGTVDLVLNNGRIITTFTELLSSDTVIDPNDTTRRQIAVDLSANTSGATIRQVTALEGPDGITPFTPEIQGDILFGSGDDTLELAGGTITGDVLFGDGDDLLTIDNGAELTGAIFDTDGQLTLDIRDGLLALGSDTALSLSTATFGANSRLQLTIDPTASGGIQSATFNASGDVTFFTGARIAPILSSLINQDAAFDLITAGNFNFAEGFDAMLDTESLPFLYNVGLHQAPGANTLVVTLNRRNAAELGMSVNQSAVYEAWFDALFTSTDESLTGIFAGVTSSDDFYTAYNQLLPEFGAAALQFTLANTDGTTGAVGNRIDALRRGYGDGGGVWIQEIGYHIDRVRSSIAQPYSGFGLGLALGIDRPLAGLDAVGFSLSGFSNQMSESQGFDSPLSSISVQAGLYAGFNFSGLDFITHSAIGLDSFDSERVFSFGSVERSTKANWSAYHLASTSRLSKDFAFGKWLFSPSVSLDYLRLTEDSYQESGGGVGVDLALDTRISENLSSTAAFTVGRRFGNDRTWWSPRLRAGIRKDFVGDTSMTTARFVGFNDRFTLVPDQLADTGLLLGFSFTAGSRYTSFGFDFDADIRDGFTRNTGKVVIRFIF